jgi:hypothetical protein
MNIELRVIPKPEHGSIIQWAKDKPFTGFVVGGGNDNLLCGNCKKNPVPRCKRCEHPEYYFCVSAM